MGLLGKLLGKKDPVVEDKARSHAQIARQRIEFLLQEPSDEAIKAIEILPPTRRMHYRAAFGTLNVEAGMTPAERVMRLGQLYAQIEQEVMIEIGAVSLEQSFGGPREALHALGNEERWREEAVKRGRGYYLG